MIAARIRATVAVTGGLLKISRTKWYHDSGFRKITMSLMIPMRTKIRAMISKGVMAVLGMCLYKSVLEGYVTKTKVFNEHYSLLAYGG